MSNVNKDNNKGLIFNIQRFSLHDGPGIRTTIFFKGCPLQCLWCHNPEGLKQSKELLYKSFSCILCKNCINSCPNNALSLNNNKITINRENCDLCGICVNNCQTNSLEVCGISISVKELVSEALNDKEYYISSKGGITISGGEPLMQFAFLKNLIIELKKQTLHVCLDTSGYSQRDKFIDIIEKIDMILFDVKTLDNKRHKRLTGVSNDLILANLRECLNHKIDVIIRIPIIKNYNFIDIPMELRDQITYLNTLGFTNFELIPYHSFGEQKYDMLGKEYKIEIKSNEFELIKEIADKLKREYSINIKLSKPILT